VDQVVLMAVFHTFNNLPKKGLSSFLVQPALLLDQFKQLTSLKELHNNGNFHVFEGEAVVDLDDVVVVE
jgi:hypothetical protein